MSHRTIVLSVFALLACANVHAEVYKCKHAGQTVFQDTPCPGEANAVPYRPMSSTPSGTTLTKVPSAGDLKTLHRQITESHAAWRSINDQYQAAQSALHARSRNKPKDELRRELTALNSVWQPRLQAATRQEEALTEELRRRCPGGAVLNERNQLCGK